MNIYDIPIKIYTERDSVAEQQGPRSGQFFVALRGNFKTHFVREPEPHRITIAARGGGGGGASLQKNCPDQPISIKKLPW